MALLLNFELINAGSSAVNSVFCIQKISNISTSNRNKQATISCDDTFPNLISCGFRTENASSIYSQGSTIRYISIKTPLSTLVDSNEYPIGHPQRCTSSTDTSPITPSYAYVQCCNFTTISLKCDHDRGSPATDFINGSNVTNTASCLTNDQLHDADYLFSCTCSLRNEVSNANFSEGTYPFDTAAQFKSLDEYPDELPYELNCTAETGDTGGRLLVVYPEMQCCKKQNGTDDIACTNFVNRGNGEVTVNCSGYKIGSPDSSKFISLCSGWTNTPGSIIKLSMNITRFTDAFYMFLCICDLVLNTSIMIHAM